MEWNEMRGERRSEVPVLIAGAGPAGLAAAVALARHGVPTLLVERRRTLSGLPRATVLSTGSMELLRAWGLEAEILAGAADVEWVGWESATLAAAAHGSPFPVGLPTREQSAAVSPTAPACVPQDHLEPVLLRHLRTFPAASVELGVELIGVQQAADGVRATVRDAGTGRTRTLRARHLIAADGAHSRARAALGIAMRGAELPEHAVTALFHAPLWDVLGTRRHGIYSVTRPVPGGTFLPAGPGDRWLYGMRWDPATERLEDYTSDRLATLIRLGAGVEELRVRIARVGAFSFAAQLADTFRRGDVFLAGDAAHRVTPRGGTGLNTALRDGADLGWKLAWVLRGWAPPALLDSYEAERRPVAEHNVARSADPNGSVREVADELHADLGGRVPHAWLPSPAGRVSTLDLLGPGLTLFTGPEAAAWEAAAAAVSAGPPLAVRRLAVMTARALGLRGAGALLARPDGAPAGWWPHGAADPAAALCGAIGAAVGGREPGVAAAATGRAA